VSRAYFTTLQMRQLKWAITFGEVGEVGEVGESNGPARAPARGARHDRAGFRFSWK
jgi:hypothetical protein